MKLKEFKNNYELKFGMPFNLIHPEYLPFGFNYNLQDLPDEYWKDIPLFEGRYQASSLGRIKSLQKEHIFGNILPEKILKQTFRGEYLSLCIYGNKVKYSKKTYKNVHVLVATTFHKKEKHHTCVNHKDGNKLNNAENNVEWVTQSENHLHAIATGLRKGAGIDNYFAKLTEKEVLEIFSSKESSIELAKTYNIHKSTVVQIRSRKIWKNLTKEIVLIS